MTEKQNQSICDTGLQGQITVFLSLILTVIISLIMVVFDGVRIQCMYMNQKQAIMIACENLLAQYCIPLYERYDLFGIDGNGRDLTNALETFISENSGNGLFVGEMTNAVISQLYPLVADSNRLLEKEVVSYMKTAGLMDIAVEQMKTWCNSDTTEVEQKKSTLVKDLNETQLQAELEMQAAKQEEQAQNNQKSEYQTDKNQQNTTDNKTNTTENIAEVIRKDPRKSVSQLMKKGVLELVMPKDSTISEKTVSIDLQTEGKAGALTDFTDLKSITQEMDKVKFADKSTQQSPIEKGVFLMYVQKHFKNVLNQEGKETCLQYEQEAILCGHASDVDNLLDAANRIVLFRMVFNLSYLMMNPTKSGEAHTVAAALSSAFALPMLEQLFYMLIMLSWSYAESIVDVKNLLAGGKIDLLKTDATWQLSMENLMNISETTLENQQKTSNSGMDYEAYIFVLMMLTNQTKIENRTVSLMQENIRLENGYETFNISDCYYGFTCIAAFSCQGFVGHFEHQTQWSECY